MRVASLISNNELVDLVIFKIFGNFLAFANNLVDFYESDNSHFAVAISVDEFDPLTSISVYLRMELEQGYIRSRMNN